MKNRYNWALFTLLISIPVTTSVVHAQSLEQAVAITLSTNPEIKSAFNEFRSQQQSIHAAKGGYYPSLDLEAGLGRESFDNDPSNTGGDDFTRRDATLSLRQLLWDGSASLLNIERTKAEAEAQRYQLIADAQDKALRVIEVYLKTLQAEEVLALTESNLNVHMRIYQDIQKRTSSGIGSTADLAQVKARVARSQSNLRAAQNNLLDSQTEFLRVVGEPPQNLVTPEVDQRFLPESLRKALEVALRENPVVQVSALDIQAAQAQYEQRKGRFYPTFTFEMTQTWTEDADGFNGSTDELSAMLRMRYNLFNGGTDTAESRQAAYQISKSRDIRERALRMIEEGARLSWSALNLTMEQKEFLQAHVDAAAETVIVYEKQFRIGKRTLLDLLNTENELFEARKSYVDAYFSEIEAQYRILNATGRLLAALRVEMPQAWQQSVYDKQQ
ncbi:TolC family outer membrane protein [Photobacterium atrarenae]|uniref:TolC family outer membrane protein n=1 Tax=Photobacterium atrarenae TaxID=865757 RepID=A0ABY5GJW5_9GAMM|nr:TolC family outer membrane protein [Photobacterium atrarenae]UTV28633.1 TolC family outer membrane protein [Photobacterium atrarenae]